MAETANFELLSLAKQRFYINIGRVNAVTEHALNLPIDDSGDERERRVTLVADLVRAVTVFLHASFEDLVRTLQGRRGKGWSFSGRADLERALGRLSLDPAEFRDLFPSLQSLARTRISIVHYADLRSPNEAPPSPRGMASLWFASYHVLGVGAFFYRLMNKLGPTTLVEDRARENADRAFVDNIDIARAILAAANAPREERLGHFDTIRAKLDALLDVLKLTPEMFLDENGNVLPGAVESLPLL
jgi:hypothetical protein